MQPRCTCGALLPEDARFCHKCGKPQLEEDIARLAAQEQTPAAQPQTSASVVPPPSAGISFRNSRAVLISISVAVAALIAMIAIGLLLPPLFPVVLCAAGFVAAILYQSRSEQPLSTAGGARLGWMTGLWMFLVVAIMCALGALSISSTEGWEQAKSMWAQIPQAARLLTLSQHDLLVQLLTALPVFFFLLTLLPGLGGMLGAKLAARRHQS